MAETRRPMVIIDTNVLRAHRKDSPPLQALVSLSVHKKIELVIPSIVADEYRSERLDKIDRPFHVMQSQIDKLTSRGESDAPRVQRIGNLLNTERRHQRRTVERGFDGWLRDSRVEVVKPKLGTYNRAFKAYFAGDAPYREARAKDDIPDSIIFEIVRDVLSNERPDNVFVITSDDELGLHFSQLLFVKVFSDLAGFLNDDRIVPLLKKAAMKETSMRLQALLSDRRQEVVDFVNGFYGNALPGTEELVSTWPGVETEIELKSIDFEDASVFISETDVVSFTSPIVLDVKLYFGMTPELYEAEKAAGFPNGHLEIVGEYFPGRYRVRRTNKTAGTATFEITFTEPIETVVETEDGQPLPIASVEVFVASLTGV